MSDEVPFYAPNRPPAPPRQPQPGERLWALTRADHRCRAELRDRGALGAELQVFIDGEFAHGRHYITRAFAIANAAGLRRTLEAEGWQSS